MCNRPHTLLLITGGPNKYTVTEIKLCMDRRCANYKIYSSIYDTMATCFKIAKNVSFLQLSDITADIKIKAKKSKTKTPRASKMAANLNGNKNPRDQEQEDR